MEVINPNEIGSKISTLVIESQTKFIAVSPYIEITSWKKILINLDKAISRGVSIEIYYREIKDEDFKILKGIGVKLFKIKGLHTKLYFNDNEFIVSSMNLYEYSDLYSIDIALHYRDSESYNKLFDYFQKYIFSQKNQEALVSKKFKNDLDGLHEYLSKRFTDSKITNAKSYLFSKNIVPIFDLFIFENEISLKLHVKNPDSSLINTYSQKLESLKNHTVIINPPTENYQWYCWKIGLKENSDLELINLIEEIRKKLPNNTSK